MFQLTGSKSKFSRRSAGHFMQSSWCRLAEIKQKFIEKSWLTVSEIFIRVLWSIFQRPCSVTIWWCDETRKHVIGGMVTIEMSLEFLRSTFLSKVFLKRFGSFLWTLNAKNHVSDLELRSVGGAVVKRIVIGSWGLDSILNQRLATAAMFLWSCVAQVLRRGDRSRHSLHASP